MPTPMRFIQLPGDSPPLYVSKSSFYKVIHPDLFNFLVILHHFMYPNQASHKVIHPGLIGTTKKLCYSQTGKLESPDLKLFHKVIHPGLIGTTKKLCYSQTGKLESPDLKVG
ncbi:hypothetical protein Bca101_100921 [Brassica carinata]